MNDFFNLIAYSVELPCIIISIINLVYFLLYVTILTYLTVMYINFILMFINLQSYMMHFKCLCIIILI